MSAATGELALGGLTFPESNHVLSRLAAGAGSVAAVMALSSGLSRFVLWPRDATEVVPDVTGTGLPDYVGPRTLAAAGLGRKSAHWTDENEDSVTRHWALAVPQQPLDSLVYSNWGSKPEKLGAALAAYYDQFYPNAGTPECPDQDVLGHSLGKVAILKGIEWARKNGVGVPHIRNFDEVSSPMSINNTCMKDMARLLAKSPLHGGMVSKAVVEFYYSLRDRKKADPMRTVGQCAVQALKKAYRGYSPMLWFGNVRLLVNASTDYEEGIFEGVIDECTTFNCYVSNNDNVVETVSAILDTKKLAVQYGARVEVHDLGMAGHANMDAASKYKRGLLTAVA